MATKQSVVTPITDNQSVLVRNMEGETMVITINERTGLVMATGDYGTFSHYWIAPGPEGLKRFLGGIQYDYAMGKLSSSLGEVFSIEKSIEAMKKVVRDNADIADIEAAIEELDDIDQRLSEEGFVTEIYQCDALKKAFGDNIYHLLRVVKVNDPLCVAFWNDFFIPFVESYMPDHRMRRV